MLDADISYENTMDPWGCNCGPINYVNCSRDPARTPMQWNGAKNAGFSQVRLLKVIRWNQLLFWPVFWPELLSELLKSSDTICFFVWNWDQGSLKFETKHAIFSHFLVEIPVRNVDGIRILVSKTAGFDYKLCQLLKRSSANSYAMEWC